MIVLVGFMGAGKSTVGRIVAERLGLPFADSDVTVEQRSGRSVRELFDGEGEAAFRRLERDTIAWLLEGPDAVVALGGGALGDPATRAALRAARVVHLRVGLTEALRRVGADAGRPLLRHPQLEGLYGDRRPVYDEVATVVVDTAGRGPEAVADEVLARLA